MKHRAGLLLIPLLAAGAAEARADELKFDIGGKIQSDLRFRVEDKVVGQYFDKAELTKGVERNQNLLSLKFKASYGKFSGVASADLYLNAVGTRVQTFGDLQKYNAVSTFSLEPQSLYVEGKNLIFKGLDLRVGNQIVLWGAGDQFNPTNNLNADDLRDPLLFGKQQPNFMVKLDYWLTRSFSFSGVLVPIFRPALLPASSALGAADIQRMPFSSDAFRHRIESEFAYAAFAAGTTCPQSDNCHPNNLPTVINSVTPVLPKAAADNMQAAFRIAGTIGEQDISLSYYYGRTDFPQPFSNRTTESDKVQCDPRAPDKCIVGKLKTDTLLGYPRMHVYGFNMSGEFNPFKKISESIHGVGYRLEAAVVVPARTTISLTQGALPGVFQPAGEYDYDGNGSPGGPKAAVVENTPFMKWTVGLDYTFGSHVYVNVQWVHGLADEFGAGDFMHGGSSVRQSGVLDTYKKNPLQLQSKCVVTHNGEQCATETLLPRLGDYLVLGADFKFLEDAALFRLFTIWALNGVDMTAWDDKQNKRVTTHYSLATKEGFAASIYPEFSYNFGNGLELGAGALVLLGPTYTKFADPAAGGSIVFTRARYSF